MKKFRISSLYKIDGIEKDVLLILDEEGRILRKTKFDELSKNYTFLDGIVFPTLINAHTHMELMEIKKIEKIDNLWDWIIFVVKKKKSIKEEDYIDSIYNGERYFNEQGIGCIGDVRSVLPEGPYLKQLSGRIFFEVLGYVEEIFDNKLKLLEKFLINCYVDKGISIHSLYTTPFSRAVQLMKIAQSNGLPVMIHLGETKFETELFFEKKVGGFKKIFPDSEFEIGNYKSYGDIIENLNFNKNFILVHCVEFTKKDFNIIKNRGISIILCPCSNLYWGNKLPDFRYILDMDIDFAIGTDSPLTNDIMNLKEDAKLILKNLNYEEKYFKKIFIALTHGGRKILKVKDTGLGENEFFQGLFIPNIYKEEELYDAFFSDHEIYLINGKFRDDEILKKQI